MIRSSGRDAGGSSFMITPVPELRRPPEWLRPDTEDKRRKERARRVRSREEESRRWSSAAIRRARHSGRGVRAVSSSTHHDRPHARVPSSPAQMTAASLETGGPASSGARGLGDARRRERSWWIIIMFAPVPELRSPLERPRAGGGMKSS